MLDPLRKLEKDGWRLTVLNPDSEGFISAETLGSALDEHTFLVSIMAANNEIGTVQPLDELGRVTAEAVSYTHLTLPTKA